jgi:hypothetical protein
MDKVNEMKHEELKISSYNIRKEHAKLITEPEKH